METFFQIAVRPHWPHIVKLLRADLTHRMRLMARAGIGEVLATLYPDHIRWRSPVLDVSSAGAGADVTLGGCGLLPVPSVFVGPQPYLSWDVADPARQLGLSAATVSEHLTVLRSSGLIMTSRHGAARSHSLTPAGEVLLNGRAP